MAAYRFAHRAERLGKSVYDHAPGAIMLSAGSAYPPALPDIAAEAVDAAANSAETLQYGPLMGLQDLREAIAGFVAADGVSCTAEDVLVTNGAKHATDLATRVFADPGDRVIVSAPTYMTTLQGFRNAGVDLIGIPVDGNGMQVDLLQRRLETMAANGEAMPKLLFDVPDFHNPTGVTMNLERRKTLIRLAEAHGFVILEDDPYRRLRFEGEAVAPIKSMDTNGVVIAIGTVSKILAPGLRVGWAIGAPEVVKRMAMQKSDGGSSPFNQRIVASLMRSNKLTEHVDEVSRHMAAHRTVMVDAIRRELPGANVRSPEGGYFLWVELPEGVSGEAVAAKGIDHGVEVSPGRVCFPEADPDRYLRLAYSYVAPDVIAEGIARLGRAYADVAGRG